MSESGSQPREQPEWMRVTPVSTPAVGAAATAVVVADGPTTVVAPAIEPVAEAELPPLLWIETLSDPVFEGLGERDLMAVEALRSEPEPWNLYDTSVTAMIDSISRNLPAERVQQVRAMVDAEVLLARTLDAADALNEEEGVRS